MSNEKLSFDFSDEEPTLPEINLTNYQLMFEIGYRPIGPTRPTRDLKPVQND